MTTTDQTAVLEVSGVQWATQKATVEAVLGRRPGVRLVDANPVAQTATVSYDPTETSVAELTGWVRDCGYHCAGQSVPSHVCDPLIEPTAHDDHTAADATPDTGPVAGHETAPAGSPHEMMGHGGHGSMSMTAMLASTDGGRTFVPWPVQPPRPLVVAGHAPRIGGGGDTTLAGVDATGTPWAFAGTTWTPGTSAGGAPQAFTVLGPDRYVVATDRALRSTDDAGRTWTDIAPTG